MKRKWIALLLCAALALPLSGCGRASGLETVDLMEGITAQEVDVQDVDGAQAVMAFSVDLFQGSMEEGSNTLISPLSVLCALAMTANGAQGDTLTQMEQVLGLTAEEMNHYLSGYLTALSGEEACQLKLANSIWFRDVETLRVEQDFLQTNADYYGADIYKAAFDESTLQDINRWVSDGTDGMIEKILDEIPPDTVMYLVNALAFDAKWEDIYEESQISSGTFTLQDGTQREVEMMHSTESVYLKDENAVGVLKYYEGGRYAFVALLPDENVTVADYVASLAGEGLTVLLEDAESTAVETAIPQFESEYSVEMN
ncbi:MAG: serpin family protein, partial [Oscillospiraceae bacterium]|nr:serpin family protein [Oscillospiraceae bacterium]